MSQVTDQQLDAAAVVLDEPGVVMMAQDIYAELIERLLDSGRVVAPGEWDRRHLEHVSKPSIGHPAVAIALAAARRIHERMRNSSQA